MNLYLFDLQRRHPLEEGQRLGIGLFGEWKPMDDVTAQGFFFSRG